MKFAFATVRSSNFPVVARGSQFGWSISASFSLDLENLEVLVGREPSNGLAGFLNAQNVTSVSKILTSFKLSFRMSFKLIAGE